MIQKTNVENCAQEDRLRCRKEKLAIQTLEDALSGDRVFFMVASSATGGVVMQQMLRSRQHAAMYHRPAVRPDRQEVHVFVGRTRRLKTTRPVCTFASTCRQAVGVCRCAAKSCEDRGNHPRRGGGRQMRLIRRYHYLQALRVVACTPMRHVQVWWVRP